MTNLESLYQSDAKVTMTCYLSFRTCSMAGIDDLSLSK
jgi:hypothetical protein